MTAITPPEPGQSDLPVRHVTRTRVLAVRGASSETRDDTLVGEEPMEIRAAGPDQTPIPVAVTMRTPGSEAELAVGFLRTEGLIGDDDVAGVEFGDPVSLSQPDDTVIVRLSHAFDPSVVAERHFVATASCGICGKASLDEIAVRCDPIPAGPTVDRATILGLPGRCARPSTYSRPPGASTPRGYSSRTAGWSPCGKTSDVTTPWTSWSDGPSSTVGCRSTSWSSSSADG